jgi:hypothetical protein
MQVPETMVGSMIEEIAISRFGQKKLRARQENTKHSSAMVRPGAAADTQYAMVFLYRVLN